MKNKCKVMQPKKVDFRETEDLKEYLFYFLKSFAESNSDFSVDYDVFESRLNTCKECEHFDSENVRCKECGCELFRKARESFNHCPIGKWDYDKEGFMKRHYREIRMNMDPMYAALETP